MIVILSFPPPSFYSTQQVLHHPQTQVHLAQQSTPSLLQQQPPQPSQKQPPMISHGSIDPTDMISSPPLPSLLASQQQHQPLKPTTVYINPSFLSQKQHSDNSSLTTAPPSSSLKPSRSRKDLEILLEKRLAEAQKDDNEEATKLKTSPSSTAPSKPSKLLKPMVDGDKPVIKRAEKSAKPVEKIALKRKSSPTRVSKIESQVKEVKKNVVQAPPAKKKPQEASVVANFTDIIDIDPEYKRKLDEQKKKREEILRAKEEKRTQRILDASRKDGSSGATTAIAAPAAVVVVPKPSVTKRTVLVSDESPTKSPAVALNNQPKRVIIQNLSLNTTETSLISMCSAVNVKDKVMKTNIASLPLFFSYCSFYKMC